MCSIKNLLDVLPGIFCLEDIQYFADNMGGYEYRAILYHDQACIAVSFHRDTPDSTLENGKFVSVRWLPSIKSDRGTIHISDLKVNNRPSYNINPFLLVPRTWHVDRDLIKYSCELWEASSKATRKKLFTTIFMPVVSSNHLRDGAT